MSYPFIKMPDGVILEESTTTETYGKFVVEPLERGFGVTLGNSFRRILQIRILKMRSGKCQGRYMKNPERK